MRKNEKKKVGSADCFISRAFPVRLTVPSLVRHETSFFDGCGPSVDECLLLFARLATATDLGLAQQKQEDDWMAIALGSKGSAPRKRIHRALSPPPPPPVI